MFNKEKFSNILIEINNKYNNMTEFAKVAHFDRSYISKYIHKRLDNPPTPKILMGIAKASKDITSYHKLMEICGYIIDDGSVKVTQSLDNPSHIVAIPLFEFNDRNLFNSTDLWIDDIFLSKEKSYFAYKTNDDSMLPLLGKGDIAIIEKTDTYENGNTCLISLDNELILIRKIIEFNGYIELHTAFPYSQPIKITNEEKEARNFTILGKVIKAENQSAFK